MYKTLVLLKKTLLVGVIILFIGMIINPSTGSISRASFIYKSNNPPYEPSNPIPPDGTENWTGEGLCWTGGDPDGDEVIYDRYLGTTTPPTFIKENHTSTCYEPGTMNYSTTYYWQIVAWDEHGASTAGPIWSFTTSGNHPPDAPTINFSGKSGGLYCFLVNSIDPDGDNVSYTMVMGDRTLNVTDFFPSGVPVEICHKFWPGYYILYFRAKDIYDAESDWSNIEVNIPRTTATFYTLFHWLLKCYLMLEIMLNFLG